MSSLSSGNGSSFLLPLYNVRKQTKSCGINEKKLIVLLIFSTVISLYFILKQLPANVNIANQDHLRFFIPKVNKSRDIIHNAEAHEHQHELPPQHVNNNKLIIPPPPDLDQIDRVDPNDPNLAQNVERTLVKNALRREQIKNVIAIRLFVCLF